MIQIFRRFFAFSGKENRHKFIRSIFRIAIVITL